MKRFITLIMFLALCTISQTVFAQSISELEAQGKAAFRNGNYSLLEDKTREIIKQSPNHRWANLQLGFALRVQGKLEEALEQYQKTIDYNSTDAWAAYAYNGLGNAFLYLGRLQEAIPAYNKAIELNPNHDFAYRNLGILFNELDQPQEAIKYFKKQLKSKQHKYPRHTYQLLADTLNSIGNKEEAINTYKEALSIKPQNGDAEASDAYIYISIADILVSQDKINEATSYYRQALSLPDENLSSTTVHSLTHTNLGILLLNNNNLSEARVEFQKALDIDPSYTYAQENLVKIEQILSSNPNPVISAPIVSEQIRPREFKNTIYEKFFSVVYITVSRDSNCSPHIRGTGWIVQREKKTAWILTNRHILFDKDCSSKQKPEILVEFYNNQNSPIKLEATIAHIDYSDDALDLALIEVKNIPDNNNFQELKMSSKQIDVLDRVNIIGHPANASPWSTYEGYISSTNREKMEIPATLNFGNSGSPVLDVENLEVVGIIYDVVPATEPGQTSGYGNALSVEIIKEQLRIWGIIY